MRLSNAAGTVKLIEQARRLTGAPVDEIVLGSYTVDARAGNSGHVYEPPLNSLGMPNPGCGYLIAHRDELAAMTQNIVISVAGDTVPDIAELVSVFDWAYAIELNLGCPNTWNEAGRQDRIASFDPEFVDWAIQGAQIGHPRVRAKLSPYSDPVLLAEVAAICVQRGVTVVASNTFPNGWLPGWGDDGPAYGGVSGLREMALGQVRQFRAAGIAQVIGCGGIRTGHDMRDFEAAGACGVQVASRYLEGGENPDVFVTLLGDYYE